MKFHAVRYGTGWIDFNLATYHMHKYDIPTLFGTNWKKEDLLRLIDEAKDYGEEKIDKSKCRVVKVTLIMKKL